MSTSEAPTAAPEPAAEAGEARIAPAVIVQALAAIGTGIGVLGFVVFCGGAVLYIRLQAAGLPAVEGVARVPREILLATGAELLVPAALVTIGVVAALYCADLLLGRGESDRLRPLDERLSDAQEELERLTDEQAAHQHDAHEAQQQAAAASTQMTEVSRGRWTRRSTAAAQLQMQTALTRLQIANQLITSVDARLPGQRDAVMRARAERERAGRRDRASRVGFGWIALFVLELVLVIAFFDSLPAGQITFLLISAGVTSAMAFAIYAGTQQFAWFSVAAFLSIGTVFGLARFYETKNNPRVAPAAVLRLDREPTAGFLVADTGDVLLLGQGEGGPAGRELLVMPRDEVEDLVLGEIVDPGHAQIASLRLLRHLCAQHTEDGGQTARGTLRTRRLLCTSRERRQVKQRLHQALLPVQLARE